MNRVLTFRMHYRQFHLLRGGVPNGACRSFSIARAADTNLGSFGFKSVLSFSSDLTDSTGAFVIGLTAGFVCLRGLVVFALARKESEILDCEVERETVGAMLLCGVWWGSRRDVKDRVWTGKERFE